MAGTMTFTSLAGCEPAAVQVSDEALFTDPLDGAYVPQLQNVHKKRFPGLVALRRMASKRGDLAESKIHAKKGSRCKTWEVESTVKESEFEQELSLKPIQRAHLAGAAVLGLRTLAGGVDDSSKTPSSPQKMMMQMILLDVVEELPVSKVVKAPMVPQPPSAALRPRASGQGKRPTKAVKAPLLPRQPSEAPRPRAKGQGKRPIPSNVQAFIVPVT